MDHLSDALDKGKYVIGVFLDFSKAFDIVDHSILQMKISNCGIKSTPFKWFEDGLNDRK